MHGRRWGVPMKNHKLILFSGFALLSGGCFVEGRQMPASTTYATSGEVTGIDRGATPADDRGVDLAKRGQDHAVDDPALRAVVKDVSFHFDAEAVEVADYALASGSTNPWMDYYRAVALADLHRTNDAVEGFKKAELQFDHGVRERSISIYGRARALNDAYRCKEAAGAYQDYADFVRPTDPRSADMALRIAADCK
jgi:hypothetical protein